MAAHSAAVRCLANGGDVVLTASDDGDVRQLNVLDEWACNDFFSAGGPVLSVAFFGTRSVVVGCADGRVLEVCRRKAQTVCAMDFGAAVEALDTDVDAAPGSRVVAAGNGRVAVWLHHRKPRDPGSPKGRSADLVAVLAASWLVAGVSSVVLLSSDGKPGRPEDVLTASPSGVQHGPPSAEAPALPSDDGGGGVLTNGVGASSPASALVRGSTERSFFVVLPAGKNKGNGAATRMSTCDAGAAAWKTTGRAAGPAIALYELEILAPPEAKDAMEDESESESSDARARRRASAGSTDRANSGGVEGGCTVGGMDIAVEIAMAPTANGSMPASASAGGGLEDDGSLGKACKEEEADEEDEAHAGEGSPSCPSRKRQGARRRTSAGGQARSSIAVQPCLKQAPPRREPPK